MAASKSELNPAHAVAISPPVASLAVGVAAEEVEVEAAVVGTDAPWPMPGDVGGVVPLRRARRCSRTGPLRVLAPAAEVKADAPPALWVNESEEGGAGPTGG